MKSNKKSLLNKAVALGLTASLAIPFAVLSEQGVQAAVTTGSIEFSLLDDDGKTFVSGSDVVIKNLSKQTGAAPVDYTNAWGFDGATADATTSSAAVTETGLEPGKYAVTAEVNASTTVTTFVDVKASDKATKVKAIALPDSTKVDQKKSGKISTTLAALANKKIVVKNATTTWVTEADGSGKFELFVPAGSYDIIVDADSAKKNNKYSVKVQAGQNSLPFEDIAADSVNNDTLGLDPTEATVKNTSKKYEGKANVGTTVRAYTYDDNGTAGDATDDEYTLIGEAISKAKTKDATVGDFSITLAKALQDKEIKFVVEDSALNQSVSSATTLGTIDPAFTVSTTAVAGKDVTLTFTDGSGLLATASDLVVKLKKSGENDSTYTTLAKTTGYTITNGKLTIKASAFLTQNPTGSGSDTDYVVSVTAAGFQSSTVTQNVKAAAAPAATATVSKATTLGIKLAATKTATTNKIYYKIFSSEQTAPKLYEVVDPATVTELTTSPTDNITSGVAVDKYLAVYELDASNRVVKYKQTKLVATNVLVATADVTLALTTPAAGSGNAITGGGATKTVEVDVVNTTASVVITGTKTTKQTVVVGGTNASVVTAGGTAAAPTYTVNTDDIKTAGGSKTFTLTVKETGKADIIYTVTVEVAAS